MNATVTSVIAVRGTLLGSTATHVFQLRIAQRAERITREEKLRQQRLDAYSAYAGLLVNFRQAMLHHWFCEHEGRDADDEVAIRRRSFELRSDTQNALFQLQMITDDHALIERATAVFTHIGKIDRARDRPDVITRRDTTRDLIDEFVDAARHHLRAAGS